MCVYHIGIKSQCVSDIGIKLLPVCGVSLHSRTHPLFMKCAVMAQVLSVRHTCIQACFLCFFSNPYISPSIQGIFSFTQYLYTCHLFHNILLFHVHVQWFKSCSDSFSWSALRDLICLALLTCTCICSCTLQYVQQSSLHSGCSTDCSRSRKWRYCHIVSPSFYERVYAHILYIMYMYIVCVYAYVFMSPCLLSEVYI